MTLSLQEGSGTTVLGASLNPGHAVTRPAAVMAGSSRRLEDAHGLLVRCVVWLWKKMNFHVVRGCKRGSGEARNKLLALMMCSPYTLSERPPIVWDIVDDTCLRNPGKHLTLNISISF